MPIETITKAVAETTKEIMKEEAKKKSEIVKILDKPLNISELKETMSKDISSKGELNVLDRPLNSKEIGKEIKPEGQESTDDAKSFWDDMLDGENDEPSALSEDDNSEKDNEVDEKKDAGESDDYFSTYEERLKQTPKEDSERGEWEGERGESKFIPNDQEVKDILAGYGLDGITYKDGIPDFSNVSESTVEIDNMTENRAENFKQCDEKCAEQWNKEACDGRTDWTARDVAHWRKETGYSWHERNDMKTCDLVPTKINDYFGHLGGVSECRKRDEANEGGDFDE
ncbi:MAG: HNH endonuclease [Lachnospiraceae bacterium]|nr:HNH endonuclease [Lachnospiraceae bacterium]